MAPEIIDGGEMTMAADVYSLSIVFWELFVGCIRPYGKLGCEEIFNLVRASKRPKFPKSFNNEDLENIITEGWRAEPKKRTTLTEYEEFFCAELEKY